MNGAYPVEFIYIYIYIDTQVCQSLWVINYPHHRGYLTTLGYSRLQQSTVCCTKPLQSSIDYRRLQQCTVYSTILHQSPVDYSSAQYTPLNYNRLLQTTVFHQLLSAPCSGLPPALTRPGCNHGRHGSRETPELQLKLPNKSGKVDRRPFPLQIHQYAKSTRPAKLL